MRRERASPPIRITIDISILLLSIAYDAITGWDTRGFVWSVWLASLLLGVVVIVISVIVTFRDLARLRPAMNNNSGFRALASGLLAFEVLFFATHYGGFHFGDGFFLNNLFPISPMVSLRDVVHLPLQAFKLFWPMAFLNLFLERDRIFKALNPDLNDIPLFRVSRSIGGLYGSVLRLHFVIILLAIVKHSVPLAGPGIYALLYLLLCVRFPQSQKESLAYSELARTDSARAAQRGARKGEHQSADGSEE